MPFFPFEPFMFELTVNCKRGISTAKDIKYFLKLTLYMNTTLPSETTTGHNRTYRQERQIIYVFLRA